MRPPWSIQGFSAVEGKSQRAGACWLGGSPDGRQGLLGGFGVARADRQEVAPRAPFAGTLVEAAGSDLAGDVADLPEVLGEVVGRTSGDVPLDLWLLGLHQHAERRLFGVG